MNTDVWKKMPMDAMDGEESERWVRDVDDGCWISVLRRRNGFGSLVWETAIVFLIPEGSRPKRWPSDDRDLLLVSGDWREKLTSMSRGELRAWYEEVSK